MTSLTSIKLGPKYLPKLRMLESLGKFLTAEEVINKIRTVSPYPVTPVDLGTIDSAVKSGASLSFEQAFGGMLYAILATNNFVRGLLFPGMSFEEAIAKGSYFLTLLAVKEAFKGLSYEEVAGLAAAGMVDVVYAPPLKEVTEFAGMGADRGWGTKKVKTINVSTLSSVVLASLGFVSMKHGSYGNTTCVGSTDVLEQFGTCLYQGSPDEINRLITATGYWFNDAHAVKTLHYLSHLLMVETVNHVVGPMTAPVEKSTKLYKVMGVNHNVHPAVVARAYAHLHRVGCVNLGGVVVLGGVDSVPTPMEADDPSWFRDHCYLDELSPVATVVSFATGSTFLGVDVLVGSSPFGITVREDAIKVPNNIETLMRADEQALTGGPLAEYLACNAALALLSRRLECEKASLSDLREDFHLALSAIESGRAIGKLNEYIQVSGGYRRYWL